MKSLRSVKGMHDILPWDMPSWHHVENVYRDLVERYGYEEIRTPILEPVELFVRGIGETTDIVEKEMYAFKDKGDAHLALRPEGTASAVRAYNQHNVQARAPQSKWYYLGPMFRRERPAKGRYRQFFQAGAELIGVQEPSADAEIIEMTHKFISMLGLGDVVVMLNTLGDESTRPKFRAALVEFFGARRDDLCEDCNRRLETNPLRILDCKNEKCKEIAKEAPDVHSLLSDDAAAYFTDLRRLLDRYDVPYEVVPTMVRGLDYYTSTIFEIQVKSDLLGSQSAVLGGGRYDNLVKELGGRDAPSIGFSFGIERLLMLLKEGSVPIGAKRFYVAGVGDEALERASDVARELRDVGAKVEFSYSCGSLKSQLKRADRVGADYTIIAGEDEAKRGVVAWRDMENGSQEEVPLDKLAARVEALL